MDREECLRLYEEKKDKFEAFRLLLEQYGKKMNLTAVHGEKEVFLRHFLDSILPQSYFPQGAKAVEIGSGGGFPSIPLMLIREDIEFTLIESTGKKCDFLKAAVEKLGLNCVQVLNIRAEEGARIAALREKFDVCCARAVARLNTLCEYCLPYVKTGGSFLAYKGECGEEIEESRRAVKILGGKIQTAEKYFLSEQGEKRTLVEIKKISSTPEKYPRGQGRERKDPL